VSAQFFSYVTIASPAATASAFRPSFAIPREKLRLKSGKTLTVCDARAFALDRNHMERLVATMTGTLMAVYDREGVKQ
jgi:hypothetical protein